MRISLVQFLVLCSLTFCAPSKKVMNSGIVVVKNKLFDTAAASVFSTDFKIWYKNSSTIEEITQINFHEDTTGRRSKEVKVLYYIFINPENHSYYRYSDFSDTARLLERYPHIDSVYADGGWNYYDPKQLQYTGTPKALRDTIINNVSFKRVEFNRYIGKKRLISTGYFRCDKKGYVFTFDKVYSRKVGCPMTRMDNFPIDKALNASSAEFDFVSDTLTPYELKVFEAWEKKAKESQKK